MSSSLCVSLLLTCSLAFAAAPDKVNPAGLPNFHEVNEHVYRGAQPSAEGFGNLAKLGVKTVIDLRGSEHSVADEQRIVEAAGMRYVSIPMRGMARPTDDQITKALALMNDQTAGPVFVHCKRGADRTGAAIACYRIQHDRWDSDKALSEARGFGMSWFQVALQHYVSGFAGQPSSQAIPALISRGLAR
jgi:uncharacterized protein (TIGR01244 family)